MRDILSKYLKGDPVIWFIVFILSVYGILAVYSSTGTLAYVERSGNTEYYLIKHVALLIFGLFTMWLTHMVNIQYFSRISQIMLWISIPLLVYTMLFGVTINDATRWVALPGIGLTVQTSDFAKVALIIYVARFMAKRQGEVHNFKKTLIPILGIILLICVLIFPEDFSTSAVLFVTSMLVLFIGRIPLKQLGVLVGIGVLVFGGLFAYVWNTDVEFGRIATMKSRIETFIEEGNDGSNFQSNQAKIAVARGGFVGEGPGNSRQKNILPSPFADFIYAIIIEEYGSILGGLALIILYLLLLYRTFRIVLKTENSLAALMSIGLAFSLVVQAFINMGVAVNILPVTGLALPIVSRGGTSILFTSIAFGIILSASRTIHQEREDAK
ncbi:MAG: FtsW/RodA/SpoVE family cell cycle protein [Bacteroidia bacterium]|nr:FtsW/RodA/SpoVE family cell cycle protein [Bacteroidia bacterium]NNJ56610.1 FtsW/RodA/SpoVE family cell cycle protein [Bacteroidia bacterium]